MDAQLTIVDVTGSTNDDLLEAENRVRRTAQDLPHGLRQQDAADAATSGIQPLVTCCSRLSYVHVLIPPSTLVLPPSAA
jgi:hypothetical protein